MFGVPERGKKPPNPLELLIATILSQNTNDVNSHKAFVNLKNEVTDFLDLADMNPRVIEPVIRVGGISRKKSKTIVMIVKEIKKYFAKFDRVSLRRIERDDLIERLRRLNGIGYKTAACVSLFALGDNDAFPVDTHVHRILNRLGVVREKTPDKTYLRVKDSIPPNRGYEIHINLIKFGRKTCTAQRPKCYDCPLYDICRWKEKALYRRQDLVAKRIATKKKKIEFMLLENV